MTGTIVYAGRIKDRSVLLKSSSGGAFTALSDYFLNKADMVIAAVYNYDRHTTEFQMIRSKEERDFAVGSKYMQSKPGNIFREAYRWLMENPDKRLLFIGMGCQADGFRKYAEMKNIRNMVYIVDIICHGSPSPKLWREYASSLEKRKGKITYLTFKDKRNGWKTPTAFVKISGKEVEIGEYVRIFYNRCALRPACHECSYAAIDRKVDLTIGDFWHIEETIPEFYEPDGNSLFLIHTERGKQLFNEIKSELDYELSDTKSCWQNSLEAPTPVSNHRQEFWNDYQEKGIEFIMKKYGRVSMKNKLVNKITKIIGGGYLQVIVPPVMLITPKGGQHNELEAA